MFEPKTLMFEPIIHPYDPSYEITLDDSEPEIVSKVGPYGPRPQGAQPFTLKYISGVVFKAKIIKEEKIDYYRPLLPISIKTYLNNIKWCCIFNVLNRFRKNCSPFKISVYEDMYNIALREKHQDCIKYIDNCHIDECQTFFNYKTARAWKVITCFGMRRAIRPNYNTITHTNEENNKESDNEENEVDIDQKDVELVVSQTGVSEIKAIKCLKTNNNDILKTIMDLKLTKNNIETRSAKKH